MGVEYTEELIERIVQEAAELLADPKNRRPAPPEAWEVGREMAAAIADMYTDDDWRLELNALDPSRAAGTISRRPPEDWRRLLELIDPDRRTEVESQLMAITA